MIDSRNPYEAPVETDESEIRLAESEPFRVVGDSLWCRQHLDLGKYCLLSGSPAEGVTESVRIDCLPAAFKRLIHVLMSLGFILVGLFGLSSVWMALLLGGFLIMIPIRMQADVVHMRFGISKHARKSRRATFYKRFVVSILAFVAVSLVMGVLSLRFVPSAWLNNIQVPWLFIGAFMPMMYLLRFTEAKLTATRIGSAVFRVENLPRELLAALRQSRESQAHEK